MPSKVQYSRCPDCKYMVPLLYDKVVHGKRIVKCPKCANKAGWFNENAEPQQGQLFKDTYKE